MEINNSDAELEIIEISLEIINFQHEGKKRLFVEIKPYQGMIELIRRVFERKRIFADYRILQPLSAL